jgi:hypothetical protein
MEKVAHHVVFGRTYRGVPIDGGTVLVVLDSDGAVSTFHKTWRGIVGESRVKLASESWSAQEVAWKSTVGRSRSAVTSQGFCSVRGILTIVHPGV